jgi:NitT/TauT family transport system substrate-binding protein
MRRTRLTRWLSLIAIGSLALACTTGGGATSSSSQAATSQAPASQGASSPSTASSAPGSGAPASGATASGATSSGGTSSGAPAGSPRAGTKEFSVAFTSLGMSSAPFLAALDDLRGQGYKIETPELAESELVTQGVASGQFAFGSGANNSTMTAVAAGAKLKLLVNRVNNEWTLYARTNITDCAGLGGKKLAIHSEGAVSTAMVKNWVKEKCSGTEPSYVVIPGSPNRLAALLADQIDASPLELTDAVTIDDKASDKFHLLASLSEDLPDLQTTSIYANGDFVEQNPGTVDAVVKAVLQQFQKIDGDAAYLQQVAEKYVGNALDKDTIEAAAKKYVELKMFPTNGGLTEENLKYTAEFFGPDGAGAVDKVLNVDEFADLSFLERARSELGIQ